MRPRALITANPPLTALRRLRLVITARRNLDDQYMSLTRMIKDYNDEHDQQIPPDLAKKLTDGCKWGESILACGNGIGIDSVDLRCIDHQSRKLDAAIIGLSQAQRLVSHEASAKILCYYSYSIKDQLKKRDYLYDPVGHSVNYQTFKPKPARIKSILIDSPEALDEAYHEIDWLAQRCEVVENDLESAYHAQWINGFKNLVKNERPEGKPKRSS